MTRDLGRHRWDYFMQSLFSIADVIACEHYRFYRCYAYAQLLRDGIHGLH